MTRRGLVQKLYPFGRSLRVVEGEEATVTLADWRERLRSDPEGTVAELVRRFGPHRSAAPEVENLYWRVLADFARPVDQARAILGRLRVPEPESPASPDRLLDLDREHRIRLRGLLRVTAIDALRAVIRDEEDLERIAEHPSRLPEAAFALRGRPAEAAALYSLEHDRIVSEPDDGATLDDAGQRRLCLAALRYETARVLQRVEGGVASAFALMERAVALVDDALGESDSRGTTDWLQLAWRLSFHAREWLGFRHFENGRYPEAEREFLRAAGAAPETDLAVAARMFAANAMIRDGRADDARRLLDSLRVATERLSPPVADEWLELRARLIEQARESPEDPAGEG